MSQFVITNSMRNSSFCPNKLQNKYLHGLDPKWYSPNRARVIGTWVHEGIEIMYRVQEDPDWDILSHPELPLREAKRVALAGYDGAVIGFRQYNEKRKKQDPQDLEDMFQYDRMLIETFIEVYYSELFEKEEFQIYRFPDELGLEKTMKAPTITPGGRASPKYMYAGKNDQAFFNPADALIYLSELKTKAKSFWNEMSKMGLKYDEQITGYLWLFRRLVKGAVKVNRVIYTVLLKPAFRQRKTETWDEFVERVRETVRESKADYVDRVLVHRTDQQIDEFGKRAYTEAIKLEKMLHGPAYINPGYGGENCVKFNKPCDYFDLCSPASRPKDLSIDFNINTHGHVELEMEVDVE